MNEQSDQTEKPAEEEDVTLAISPEKVCFIIVKAREFDAKEGSSGPAWRTKKRG